MGELSGGETIHGAWIRDRWESPCGRAVLYLADNRDVLPMLAPESVDAVITDPPYGFHGPDDKGRRRNIGRYQGSKSVGGGGTSEFRDLDLDWNDEVPTTWLPLARPALVHGAALLVFTDRLRPHKLERAMKSARVKFLGLVYWVKTNPPTSPGSMFMSSVELGVFGRKPGGVRCWNGRASTPNVIRHAKVDHNHNPGHPTPKPEGVMRWCIEPVTDFGMLILDPFMGSGTTGAVALKMGRRFIGIERHEPYYRAARDRIEAVCEQGRLFEPSTAEGGVVQGRLTFDTRET